MPSNRPQSADSAYACIACGCGMNSGGPIQGTTICAKCWQSLSIAERIAATAQFDQAHAVKNHAWQVARFGEIITAAQQSISAAAKEIRTASQEVANLFEEAREDYLKRRKDGEFDE